MSEQGVLGVALIGLGKMGVSHLAIANASRRMKVEAVVDSTPFVGQVLGAYCGLNHLADYRRAFAMPGVQAAIVATPTESHEELLHAALDAGLHVFCEKPMTLASAASRAIAAEAKAKGLVGQVGYHNRFAGTFAEAKRILDAGVIGRVRHIHAEAYGPVVLRPSGKTWRSRASAGGGCLLDYAAHPINLMNWYAGAPTDCIGANLTQQYSTDVEDAVYAELRFAGDVSGQVSVNWSDETVRKMTTRISVFGDGGKLVVDRQELVVFSGARGGSIGGYGKGWSVRNTVELTPAVDYYLRGEEYSAQLESFAMSALDHDRGVINDFDSAAVTDETMSMIRARANAGSEGPAPRDAHARRRGFLSLMSRR